jgi:hypothetical protein
VLSSTVSAAVFSLCVMCVRSGWPGPVAGPQPACQITDLEVFQTRSAGVSPLSESWARTGRRYGPSSAPPCRAARSAGRAAQDRYYASVPVGQQTCRAGSAVSSSSPDAPCPQWQRHRVPPADHPARPGGSTGAGAGRALCPAVGDRDHAGRDQDHLSRVRPVPGRVCRGVLVESARSAVPVLPPVRISVPLAEPGVPVSEYRALHGLCRSGVVEAGPGAGDRVASVSVAGDRHRLEVEQFDPVR